MPRDSAAVDGEETKGLEAVDGRLDIRAQQVEGRSCQFVQLAADVVNRARPIA